MVQPHSRGPDGARTAPSDTSSMYYLAKHIARNFIIIVLKIELRGDAPYGQTHMGFGCKRTARRDSMEHCIQPECVCFPMPISIEVRARDMDLIISRRAVRSFLCVECTHVAYAVAISAYNANSK